jgi:uncharacterized protein DUF2752
VWFGLLGAALVSCAVVFAIWGAPPLPPAPMVLLGIPSPLTGMTRSFVALASGDVTGAFRLHPLGPLCFAACIAAAANLAASLRSNRRPTFVDRVVSRRATWWLVATAFAVAWIRQIVVFS